ncbi:MAG: DUF805 domain-containing protein [Thermoguttaceae bacterium]|nr:DUF805 domain-containing protein [Thermoguttaceae bacterium]
MSFCPYCGAESGGGNYCASCGAQLATDGAENPYAVGSQTQASGSGYAGSDANAPDIPTFLGAYPTFWKKWRAYHERSSRREFWYVMLWQLIILIPYVALVVNYALNNPEGAPKQEPSGVFVGVMVFYGVYLLACLMPGLNLAARRLHDANLSAWLLLLYFIPQIGGLAQIIFGLLPPTQGPNKYGAQPRKRRS